MTKEYDKILFRLTDILTKLSSGETPSLSELALEYNVSIRTIQRDIYTRLNKFPIVINESKRLQFTTGFSLNRIRLNIEEIMTITLSLELIKNKGTEFQKASHSLMHKIMYEKVLTPYYIKPTASESIDTDSVILNLLEEAILHNNCITVVYQSDIHEKSIPIKIINFDGFWYLLSKVENEVQIEMISTIKSVTILSEKSTLSDAEKKLFEKAHTPFFNTKAHFHVTLKIAPCVAHYFRLKQFLPSQTILREESNGSLIVEYGVSHLEEVDNLVKAWLPDIEIIEPQSYKDRFISELQNYLVKIHGGV